MPGLIIRPLFLFILFVLLSVCSEAFGNDLVQELIIKSGLKTQIEQFPLHVQEGFRQQALQQIPEEISEEIYRAMTTSLSPNGIERLVHKGIGDHLSSDEIKAVLRWLDSPLGKELTRLEKEASTPEAQEIMSGYLDRLLKDREAPDRLKLLQRMEAAFNSTDATISMILNIQVAVISALSTSTPSPNPLSFDQIIELVDINRAQLRSQLSHEIISNFLYAYRTVDISDLERYTMFVESKVGSKYHKIVMNALSNALIETSRNMGEAIGHIFNDPSAPSSI